MATIASLVVNLGLASASFTSGLKSAKGSLAGFGRDIKSFATSATGIFTGLAAAAGVGLSMHAGISAIKSTMEEVDKLNKQARAIGVTTDALSRLQYAAQFAGMEAGDVAPMLAKMSRSLYGLGDAGTAGKAIQIAIQSLGLSMKDLGAMSPDKQFETLAEAIRKVANPTERMGVAMAIFGKNAAAAMPLLMEGKEGLAAWFAESDKYGNTVSPINAQMIENAQDNVERLGRALHGVALIVTAELAPFIEAATKSILNFGTTGTGMADKVVSATKSILNFGTTGTGMADKVVSAFEWVVTAVAKLADWLELLKGLWYGIKAVVLLVAAGWLDQINVMGAALVTLVNLIPGVNVEWDKGVKAMADSVWADMSEAAMKAEDAQDAFWQGKNSAKATAAFAAIRNGAKAAAQAAVDARPAFVGMAEGLNDNAENIQKTLDDLKNDLATFGMSSGAKKIFDLKAMGADPTALAQAQKYVDELAKLDASKKMAEEGAKLAESLRTPLEEYNDQLQKLDEMRKASAISAETYQRGADKAAADFIKAGGDTEIKRSTATEQRFAFTYRAEKQANDPMVSLAKQQLVMQQRSALATEKLATAAGTGADPLEID